MLIFLENYEIFWVILNDFKDFTKCTKPWVLLSCIYVYPVAFLILNLNNQGLKNIVFQPYEIGKEGADEVVF